MRLVQPYEAHIPVGYDHGLRFDPEQSLSRRGRQRQRDQRRQMREQCGKRYTVVTSNILYGTYTAMTVTNLQSLATDASDPYAGWQSARVSNVATLADDYEVYVGLVLTTGTIGSATAAYVYVIPWMTTDGGTTWLTGGNFSTVVAPTGTEGTASISDPNSMKGPISIPAKVQSQKLETYFTIAQTCGVCPDGWSLAIRVDDGINLTVGCVVAYRPINETFS